MGDRKYDWIIVNLKSIAQVPRNRRLRTNNNGYLTLEDNHLLVPLRRKIYGEGRDKLIRDIKSLMLEVQAQVRLLLSSKYLNGNNGNNGHADEDGDPDMSITPNAPQSGISRIGVSDEKRNVIEQISSIHRELLRSTTGLENLKGTYSNDILMVGELEHVIDQIRLYMDEIEKKVPDVAENIPPVLLEKPA